MRRIVVLGPTEPDQHALDPLFAELGQQSGKTFVRSGTSAQLPLAVLVLVLEQADAGVFLIADRGEFRDFAAQIRKRLLELGELGLCRLAALHDLAERELLLSALTLEYAPGGRDTLLRSARDELRQELVRANLTAPPAWRLSAEAAALARVRP